MSNRCCYVPQGHCVQDESFSHLPRPVSLVAPALLLASTRNQNSGSSFHFFFSSSGLIHQVQGQNLWLCVPPSIVCSCGPRPAFSSPLVLVHLSNLPRVREKNQEMVKQAGVLGHTAPLFLAWALDWVPMPCLSHIGRLGALLPHGMLHELPVGAGAFGASWACAIPACLAGWSGCGVRGPGGQGGGAVRG